uniref:TATA-binding protein-associated factor 172-like n=1 Tax=Sinocyclocheilus grahami TaxID=75366 RepID=A0A672R0Q8_SINGR
LTVCRLERLFILLDTGTTPVTRKAAAQQLGDVVKLHPHELNNLLSKVLTYLRSPNWDTRIAAGQAVEAIVKKIPEWNPAPKQKDEDMSPEDISSDKLSFYRFDISRLLKHGASLLGSAGAEFELQDDKSGETDPKERLARQRKQLQKKLGLDMGAAIGMDTEELFNDEDLEDAFLCSLLQPAAELIDSEFRPGMSNRQKNKAKRMAKLVAKQRSRDVEPNEKSNDSFEGEPEEKRRKTTNVVIEQPATNSKVLIDNVPDNTSLFEETPEWPLESMSECGIMGVVVFIPTADAIRRDSGRNHCNITSVILIKKSYMLCLLSLTHLLFGVFVSSVVAPVRETCAQTLGVALRHMADSGIAMTVDILLKLLTEDQWEVRHGGLLGIKYALAVRQDLIAELLPQVLPAITEGLRDLDDDVRAVAAAALIPVVDGLVQLLPTKVPFIVDTLWNALLELDDLTASTNSIMTLLSSLLAYPQVRQCSTQQSLTVLVPRVWPFLRHTIASVRRAALETLFTLLSKADQSCAVWLNPIMQDMLRHIFQSCILESNQEILELIQKVWGELLRQAPQQYVVAASCPWMGAWLCLMMQAPHIPIEPNMLLEVKARLKEKATGKTRQGSVPVKETVQEYIGGAETVTEDPATRDYVVTRARLMAAKLLGALCSCICDPRLNSSSQELRPAESLAQLLLFHLNSKSALQRIAVSMVICEWAGLQKECELLSSVVQPRLLVILSEQLYYDEIAIPFTRMQNECKQLIALLADAHIDVRERINSTVFTIDQANELVTTMFSECTSSLNLKSSQFQLLDSKRLQARSTVCETSAEWQQLQLRVHTFSACAVVGLAMLPDKLNPVVRPLMEAARREENTLVQGYAASNIARLLQLCASRSPCPNAKIVKNLCSSVCVDPKLTPSAACPVPPASTPAIQESSKASVAEKDAMHHMVNKTKGIITLYRHQKAAFAITSKRGPTPKAPKTTNNDLPLVGSITTETDESKKPCLIQRRGAEFCLMTVARHFGKELSKTLPYLWESMTGPLRNALNAQGFGMSLLKQGDSVAQELVNSLQVLEVTTGAMSQELIPLLMEQLALLCTCLQHPYTAVRHMAARCVGVLSKIATMETMNVFLEYVLPWLGAIDDHTKQEGAIEALACVMEQLDVDIVPYIVLLVVPVLGRMSDPGDSVRFMATQCFATLIRLLPLEAGIPDPPSMSEDLIRQKARERHFLEQLLDGRKLENYKIPVPIKAELRKYQQDGVNWLAFLNKYKLHGILCDDMGLGKTLQSICILAGDHFLRAQEYARTKAPDCCPLPSIVVCPPTLTGHWVDEVGKFCSKEYLNPLHYTGPPTERAWLQHQVKKHNLVVASYDVVRNDIDFFRDIKFNYCILDEGHVIKNGKTKLSKAIKQLTANYRIILSGTPIQVRTELFDGLYTLPFKSLGSVERIILAKENFQKTLLQSSMSHDTSEIVLSMLKKPLKLFRPPLFYPLTVTLSLLLDCGLGSAGASDGGTEAVVAQHRVLIFCQLKSMLDIVEQDLLKAQLPTVTYLRLDGSVQAGLRHSIVSRFNNDPSIDVLLLTTHVGGLGLNLTGADTVVFVEHDWNPMRDLQAMGNKVVYKYYLTTQKERTEKSGQGKTSQTHPEFTIVGIRVTHNPLSLHRYKSSVRISCSSRLMN